MPDTAPDHGAVANYTSELILAPGGGRGVAALVNANSHTTA